MPTIRPSRSHRLDWGERRPKASPKLAALDAYVEHHLSCRACSLAILMPDRERCSEGLALWERYRK